MSTRLGSLVGESEKMDAEQELTESESWNLPLKELHFFPGKLPS
jgi:hypothetical protein